MEAQPPHKAFVSYSWDSEEHKSWVADLATRLRSDGVDAVLDQWAAVPGDQLPQFMEREIRENDFVLIVCTPNYRLKSDERTGGVGYEGDIMTAEVHVSKNHRKFIPILAVGEWRDSAPSWLKGKYYIDMAQESRFESGYADLLATLKSTRQGPPPLGATSDWGRRALESLPQHDPDEPVRILGVVVDEVSTPKNDGTQGSALYNVPFQLSRPVSIVWGIQFRKIWDSPPRFTTMHRPGIASANGDRIVLAGTTVQEIEKYHRDTLVLCVEGANEFEQKLISERIAHENEKARQEEEHRANVEDVSKRLKFD